ncbi:aldehyde dehydrogenase [Pyrenochaeta sp. DS3sAY3a]|nr:aldehyde dehydrogenase [Pyrenochaeta sp. DS3sAY3a]
MSASSFSDLETRLFIDNKFVPAKSNKLHSLFNPVDDSLVTDKVHLAGPEDVETAVLAAEHAFRKGEWSSFTGAQRALCLNKFAALAEANAPRLAQIESIATGRPVAGIQFFDIPNMVQTFRYYAGWADKIAGQAFHADDGLYKIVQYEPLGVCAGVAAWNATFLYVGWKIAPAVAAGNTFIFKSSEKSPLGALALGPLFVEAGFPPGVVQFLSGAGDAGAALASHHRIAKISFTGSGAVGRKIQDAATKSNLKRVTLELGGKSPAIVFPDAPMDVALPSVGNGFLANSGQICAAASRAFVHESIAATFVAGLKKIFETATTNLGASPLELTTDHGPVVDRQQFDKIMSFIDAGKSTAELVTGGSRKGEKGCFIEPTIFLNPSDDSPVLNEEIFGPVLCIKTFKTEEEVIELANNTVYGLASCVYTTDITRALRVAGKIQAGGVSINTPHLPCTNTPFGGTKESGYGKELGMQGLMNYLEAKTIHINMNVRSNL